MSRGVSENGSQGRSTSVEREVHVHGKLSAGSKPRLSSGWLSDSNPDSGLRKLMEQKAALLHGQKYNYNGNEPYFILRYFHLIASIV